MEIIRDIGRMQRRMQAVRKSGKNVGFVPTMGALHRAHQELFRMGRRECGCLVVSLFVNPAQFGPGEDFSRYPRPFRRDALICREERVDILFAPSAAQMYPPGFETSVDVRGLSRPLCGRFRPGHFRGVATVVAKLFHIVGPDIAYFGRKDYQQLKVIEKMVRDLNFPVKIKSLSTVREQDGLALSSRNRYLETGQRRGAAVLCRSMDLVQNLLNERQRSLSVLKREMRKMILRAVPDAVIEYIEFVHPESLHSLRRSEPEMVLALAVRIGSTRLIDNRRIKKS